MTRQAWASRGSLRRKLLCAAVASCFGGAAHANPTGAVVASGQVSFASSGTTLTVSNSPNAIINWQSFSIGSGETTHFQQQSVSSAVLNRVIGSDPSSLLGTLTSNGQVFLINPAGILVGQGATIDVAGLVASTLALSDDNFRAGNFRFGPTPAAGNTENLGDIRTPEGGSVYLIGSNVSNRGLIQAAGGEVLLAAGDSVQLIDTGTPGVAVEITGGANQLSNLGRIVAESGRIGLVGAAIANQGLISASSLVREGGRIFLKAKSSLATGSDSLIEANGATGGSLMLQTEEGDTLVQGRLTAQGSASAGTGGSVQLLGQRVALLDGAAVDASGSTHGGTVLVGGDFQGSNSEIPNAAASHVAETATIRADAVQQGDGGTIVVWADGVTRFRGSISARGGSEGGNGGLVETSGKQYLEAAGQVDASATQGLAGTWLLDPRDVSIVSGTTTGGNFSGGNPNVFDPSADSATVLNTTLNASLNNGTSVIIQTGSSGSQSGNITVAADITKADGSDATLQLDAAGSIIVGSGVQIRSSVNKLHVIFDANADNAGNGRIELQSGSAILSNGGNVALYGGGDPKFAARGTSTIAPAGILLDNATIRSGDGAIYLHGAGVVEANVGNAVGVQIQNGSVIESSTGNIDIIGIGSPASGITSGNRGVLLTDGATLVQTALGDITIKGTGGGEKINNDGVLIANGAGIVSTVKSTIAIVGDGSATTQTGSSAGVVLADSNSRILATDGLIVITGTGQGNGADNFGVLLWDPTPDTGPRISAAGDAAIAISGQDAGSGGSLGVALRSSGSTINANLGSISITADTTGADAVEFAAGTGVSGNGPLILQPLASTTSLGVAGGAGVYNLSSSDLGALANGFSNITIGRADGAATLTIGAAGYNFQDSLTLLSPSGTVDVLGGLNLALGSGTATIEGNAVNFGSGVTVTGTQTSVSGGGVSFNSGAVTFDSQFLSSAPVSLGGATVNFNYTTSLADLTLSSGSLQGTGNATVSGNFNILGGTLAGSGALTTQGTTTVNDVGTANASLSLTGKTWVNEGTLTLGGDDFIQFTGGTNTLTNAAAGTFNLATSNATPLNHVAGVNTINNQGTLTQTASGAHSIDNSMFFDNTGVVHVEAGTLRIGSGGTDSGTYAVDAGTTIDFAGGTRNLNAGSDVTGTGAVVFSGGVNTLNGNYAIAATGTTTMSGGDLHINVPLTFANTFTFAAGDLDTIYGSADLTFDGALNWSGGGGILGTGTLTTNGVTTIVDAGNGFGRDWTNNGTVNITANGRMYFYDTPSTWTNTASGVINLQSTVANPIASWSSTGHSLVNLGVINKSAGSGATLQIGDADLSVTNAPGGALNVVAGTLSIGAGLTQSGTLQIASGATFQKLGGFTNAGTILGEGVIDVGAGTLSNSGTLRPGAASIDTTGTLSISGNLSNSGTIDLQLDNFTTGDYDKLSVSGTATLGGTLNVSGVGPNGDYQVLAASSVGGTFGTVNSGGLTLTPVYNPTDVRLHLSGDTFVWDGGAGSSNWLDALNWLGDLAPVGGSNVLLDLPGTPTIAFDGTVALGSFSSNETLLLGPGGTLTVGNGLFNAGLTLDNATLSSAGNVTINGAYSQTGGSVNVADLTINSVGGFALLGQLGTLQFANSGNGGVNVQNSGALTVNGSNPVGSLFIRTASPLTVDASGLSAAGNILLHAPNPNGNLTLNGPVSSTGGDIVLNAESNFINNVGAGALSVSAGQRWLVYSASPAGSFENGLVAAAGSSLPRLYGRTYASAPPAAILEPGNHLIYAAQPVLTVTAGDALRTYGATNPTFGYSFSGLLSDDGYTDTLAMASLSGFPGFTTPAGVASPVGSYAITPNLGSLTSGSGYQFGYADGTLTVNPAAITVTAADVSKFYGETTVFSGSEFNVSGLQNGETIGNVTLASAGAAGTANVALYSITAGGASGGTFDAGNYSISYVDGSLGISPRPISILADPAGKTYGAADPLLSYSMGGMGLVNGDTLSGELSRAAGETVGSYAIGLGSLDAGPNYFVSYTSANFSISPALLSVLADSQVRVYGDTNPVFSYAVSGLQFSDTAGAVLSGSLGTSADATSDVGSYFIGQGSLAANPNYTLDYTGNTLDITPATLYYVADPAIRSLSQANPAFSGTISGFKLSDTLATETSGTPLFSTTAGAASPPGLYAIDGSGLTLLSGNYALAQDPGNATAFAITPDPSSMTEFVVGTSQLVAATNSTTTLAASGGTSGTSSTGTLAPAVAPDIAADSGTTTAAPTAGSPTLTHPYGTVGGVPGEFGGTAVASSDGLTLSLDSSATADGGSAQEAELKQEPGMCSI